MPVFESCFVSTARANDLHSWPDKRAGELRVGEVRVGGRQRL